MASQLDPHYNDNDQDAHEFSDEYEDPVVAPVDSAVIRTAEAVSISKPAAAASSADLKSPSASPVLPARSPERLAKNTDINLNESVDDVYSANHSGDTNNYYDDDRDAEEDENEKELYATGNESEDIEKSPALETSITDEDQSAESTRVHQNEFEEPGSTAIGVGDEVSDTAAVGVAETNPTSADRISNSSSPSTFPAAPALPSRANHASPPPLPPRKRAPFFWLKSVSPQSPRNAYSLSGSVTSPEYDLVMQRLDANKERLQDTSKQNGASADAAIKQLQRDFENVKIHHTPSDMDVDEQGNSLIDWEFWTSVVTDYAAVARQHPQELSRAIASGFPPQLRGLIWQLIAASKNATLEEMYQNILQETSPHEKAIKRDLARTSFIKNADSDSLFRIIKAYSLYDPEVGYTQGMAFIAVPLLINMSESEAFCLLVCLMKDYGFRSMFLPEMPGLHLRLYQFDRIIEDTLPSVHIHLSRQGVRSSMYASQWFLTLFAYKFPLQIVMRIFDIVISEGIEAILRFGVALIKKNAQTLLSLEFDSVLTFLKERIFDCYLFGTGSEVVYNVNELVADAYSVRVLPLTLRKYENEYTEIHRIERERVEEVENLRSTNGMLTLQVRRLETNLATLNKEHIDVANEMVQGRLEIARLQDENEQLALELNEFKEAAKNQPAPVDDEPAEDVVAIQKENAELKETRDRLEAQLTNLERELLDTRQELASLEDAHNSLKSRWAEIRKHFDESI